MGGEDEVLPSKGTDWSLNKDAGSDKKFWWHKTYSISVWAGSLPLKVAEAEATDDDVWKAFIEFRIETVYKICGVCNGPEQDQDLKVCCYCGHNVHQKGCSVPATAEQMAWKKANAGFEKHLVACVQCEDIAFDPPKEHQPEEEGPRRCAIRALSIANEYPNHLRSKLHRLRKQVEEKQTPALMKKVQETVREHFQPNESSDLVERLASVIDTFSGGPDSQPSA